MTEEFYTEYGGEEPVTQFHLAPNLFGSGEALIEASPELIQKWHLRDSEAIFNFPYREPEALIPFLQLARGRPMGIVGPPGGGKNDMVQAIALSVASGKDCFGQYPVLRQGRVIHITYDMGDWATRIRYRRLANGMALQTNEVRDKIALSPYPDINLTHFKARKEFAALLKGFDLAILDNARAASPGINENDSTFGERITAFGQACEDAGAIGCYLHHSRKGLREQDEEVTIESLRGTSAIAGASGAVWYIAPTDGPDSPRIVRMLRTHDVMPDVAEDFYLHHVPSCAKGCFDVGNLAPIRLIASPELGAPGSNAPDATHLILNALRASPGMKVSELIMATKLRHAVIRQALDDLLQMGQIVELKSAGNVKQYAIAARV